MKTCVFSALCLAAVFLSLDAKNAAPHVQIYSRNPAFYDEKNVLICHMAGFQPPQISVQLLKNGVEIPDTNLTELAFEGKWQYYLTRSISFTPKQGERYTCQVTHLDKTTTHEWGIDD
ncbi:hypothetical protein NHX12_020566 [Muraenolepis orangiensis]|uniref:Beta-2-microglobulin n=1 Tax=Muraenolepis orangiensis TaxID=630683 RepID=A0A9Q0EV60_9TELE|nr:hypothetical protein NHX12_020566 [Muraenolepis orangiensis]